MIILPRTYATVPKYENGAYTFNKPTWSKYAGTISTWSAMFSIRYTFN